MDRIRETSGLAEWQLSSRRQQGGDAIDTLQPRVSGRLRWSPGHPSGVTAMSHPTDLSVAQTFAAGSSLSRRRLLASAVALAAAASSSRVLAQSDEPIRLGQSVALTGPL